MQTCGPSTPPESAAQTPHTATPVASTTPRRVTRDLLSGRIQVDFPRWTYQLDMPDIGHSHGSAGSAIYEITDGDPLSAKMTTDYRVSITRADTTITHHSTGTLTCDATHFTVAMSVRISEQDEPVFARDWHERIPRDMV